MGAPLAILVLAARAGTLATWGAGEVGHAGNAGVAADGPHAAWYNPAAMAGEGPEVSLELVWGAADFEIDGETAGVTDPTRGLLIGSVFSGRPMRLPWLHLGVTTFFPFGGPYRWDESAEPGPEMPRFEDELTRIDMAAAAGAHLGERLSVGVGADLGRDVETEAWITEPDDGDPEGVDWSQAMRVRTRAFPFAGAIAVIGDPGGRRLRVGLVGRTSRSMREEGTTYIDRLDVSALQRRSFVRFQAPASLTFGAEGIPGDRLSVRAEGSWERWSYAVDSRGDPIGDAWTDTLTFRAGIRAVAAGWAVLGGVGLDPGPATRVPDGSSIFDGPSYSATVGLSAPIIHLGRKGAGPPLRATLGGKLTEFPTSTLAGVDGSHSFHGTMLGGRLGVTVGNRGPDAAPGGDP